MEEETFEKNRYIYFIHDIMRYASTTILRFY